MFSELTDILSGEKEAPEIPFKIEFDTRSTLIFAGIMVVAAVVFVLILKAIK